MSLDIWTFHSSCAENSGFTVRQSGRLCLLCEWRFISPTAMAANLLCPTGSCPNFFRPACPYQGVSLAPLQDHAPGFKFLPTTGSLLVVFDYCSLICGTFRWTSHHRLACLTYAACISDGLLISIRIFFASYDTSFVRSV